MGNGATFRSYRQLAFAVRMLMFSKRETKEEGRKSTPGAVVMRW
jgi:hypothetical protein